LDLNQSLPYPDGIFDKVVSVNVLYALNAKHIIAEFYRLLKPNGRLILVNSAPGFKQMEIFKEHLSRISNLATILKTCLVIPVIIMVGACNLVIDAREKKGEFQSLSKDDIGNILRNNSYLDSSVKLTYANQDYLFSIKK